MSVFKIVKKELMCHIANWLVLFLIPKSVIIYSGCPFFTILNIRVFHRLKRNIFRRNIIIATAQCTKFHISADFDQGTILTTQISLCI